MVVTAHRSYIGMINFLFLTVGGCFLALLAYLTPNWRYLMLAVSLPSFLPIMDSLIFFSGSIGKGNLKKCLGFLRNFVQSFYIAEDGSHVGVVLFSSTAEVMLNFEKYFYSDLMMDAIDKIPYPAKSTYAGIGLDLVRTGLFEISERQGVRDILIVITDGASRVRIICNNNQRAQPPKNTSEPLKNKTS